MKNKSSFFLGIASVFILAVIVLGFINKSNNGYTAVGSSHSGTVSGVTVPTGNNESENGVKASKNFAPDFTLESLDGSNISLSDYRGVKPVVLDFWASWCHNCQRDMPVLNKLYDKYSDDVEVIGVNLQESKKKAQGFVDSNGINFPIALDSRGKASRNYAINYTNTHVLINKEGEIVRFIPGDIREADIRTLIQ
jgi:peroxiredoxin